VTPTQKVAALRRAEKALDAVAEGHPAECRCGVCEAAMAAWKARVDITRPGWRDLVGHVERLPEDAAPAPTVPCWCFKGFDGDGATCPACNGTAEVPSSLNLASGMGRSETAAAAAPGLTGTHSATAAALPLADR
jgi:hypothetical protein